MCTENSIANNYSKAIDICGINNKETHRILPSETHNLNHFAKPSLQPEGLLFENLCAELSQFLPRPFFKDTPAFLPRCHHSDLHRTTATSSV